MSTLQVANVLFESTANNRVQYIGSNTITVSTAGTERVRIDNAGNIGIGTSSPGYKLDINGTLNVAGNATFANTIAVTGNATFSNTIAVTGNATFSNTVNLAASGIKFSDATTQTTAAVTAAAGSQLIQGTAQASTSGTSIDFTGIPSWVKRVTVMFNGVSTNGSSLVVFQTGAGSIQTSGYTGTSWGATGTASNANANWLSYATTNDPGSAATVRNGTVVFSYLGSNIWSIIINFGCSNTNYLCAGYGTVTLSGALDRIRITTVNGTDTFDAGSINILYE